MTRRARFTRADLRRAWDEAERRERPHAIEIAPDGSIRIVPVDRSEAAPDHDPFMEGIANAQAKKGRRHAAA